MESVKTAGLVLSSSPFSDSGLVVRIFTRENGLKSFLVKGARKPNASFKAGYFLPLTLMELVYRANAGEGLNFLKECRPWPILQAIRFDPIKAQVGVFMAEVFKKAIHEHHRDDVLYDFAEQTVIDLESTPHALAAFPVWFLAHLSTHLGVGLSILSSAEHEERYLSVQAGQFNSSIPTKGNVMPLQASQFVHEQLSNPHFIGTTLNPNKEIRHQALDGLLAFFAMHFWDTAKLKSLDILKSLHA